MKGLTSSDFVRKALLSDETGFHPRLTDVKAFRVYSCYRSAYGHRSTAYCRSWIKKEGEIKNPVREKHKRKRERERAR